MTVRSVVEHCENVLRQLQKEREKKYVYMYWMIISRIFCLRTQQKKKKTRKICMRMWACVSILSTDKDDDEEKEEEGIKRNKKKKRVLRQMTPGFKKDGPCHIRWTSDSFLTATIEYGHGRTTQNANYLFRAQAFWVGLVKLLCLEFWGRNNPGVSSIFVNYCFWGEWPKSICSRPSSSPWKQKVNEWPILSK